MISEGGDFKSVLFSEKKYDEHNLEVLRIGRGLGICSLLDLIEAKENLGYFRLAPKFFQMYKKTSQSETSDCDQVIIRLLVESCPFGIKGEDLEDAYVVLKTLAEHEGLAK